MTTATLEKKAPTRAVEPLRYPDGQIVRSGDTYDRLDADNMISLCDVAYVNEFGVQAEGRSGLSQWHTRSSWVGTNRGTTGTLGGLAGARYLISRR